MCHSSINPTSSSGARLGGTSEHGEPPLAIPLMVLMITQEQSNRGSNWRLDWFSCRISLKLGPDLSSGTSHATSVHVFLKTQVPNALPRPLEWPMNIINPIRQGGYTPFHPKVTFSGGCMPKSDQFV